MTSRERAITESAVKYDAVEHPSHYTAHPSGVECVVDVTAIAPRPERPRYVVQVVDQRDGSVHDLELPEWVGVARIRTVTGPRGETPAMALEATVTDDLRRGVPVRHPGKGWRGRIMWSAIHYFGTTHAGKVSVDRLDGRSAMVEAASLVIEGEPS